MGLEAETKSEIPSKDQVLRFQ